jgi:CRP/FNR family transcriptional regulator, cyclic AMP receptor protein
MLSTHDTPVCSLLHRPGGHTRFNASARLGVNGRRVSRFEQTRRHRHCDALPMPATGRKAFDARRFLDSSGGDRTVVRYREGETVYSQGDPCNAVMYLRAGEVRLSVLSRRGKEAIVAVLPPGTFFGEGALAGQRVRPGTAKASAASTVLVIERKAMTRHLHEQSGLSDRFIAHLLTRNARIEANLVDLLFNSAERRLARTLLTLARFGEVGRKQRIVSKISQQTLADMVGTTRSRINFFINRFKKLGYLEDRGGLTIHSSLLSLVLHDEPVVASHSSGEFI